MGDPKKEKNISLRKFVDLSFQAFTEIGLAHTFTVPMLVSSSGCNPNRTKIIHGACYHDCLYTCSWTVTATDNKVTEFKASYNNPFTAGKLCGKMKNITGILTFHPDRILTHLKRDGKKKTRYIQTNKLGTSYQHE